MRDGGFVHALPMGTALYGEYIIKDVLGQGGFGITYDAEVYRTGERVAVKEYFPTGMSARDSSSSRIIAFSGEPGEYFRYGKACFLQEARRLARFMRVPRIVHIRSFFEENGTAYFVMEKVDGISLKSYVALRGGRMGWGETLRLLLPVMDALEAVHAGGVVHRDIAPDNILIDKGGNATLIDFGAAVMELGKRIQSLNVVLKRGFAPIEQYLWHGSQGAFTDVYAMAATFYFCICGQRPVESIGRIVQDKLALPRSLGVDISMEQELVLRKGLAISVRDRYQSMGAFGNALQNALAPYVPNNGGSPFRGGGMNGGGGPFRGRGISSGGTRGEERKVEPYRKKAAIIAIVCAVISLLCFALLIWNAISVSHAGV